MNYNIVKTESKQDRSKEIQEKNNSQTREDIHEWLAKCAKRGTLPANTARIWGTAITQLQGILDDDEPKTLKYLLENVGSIGDRFLQLNDAKASTVNVYISRVRTSIGEYFTYLNSPRTYAYKSKKKTTSTVNSKSVSKKKSLSNKASAKPNYKEDTRPLNPSYPPSSPNRESRMEFITLNADGSRRFMFEQPEGGLDSSEILRIFSYLLDRLPAEKTRFSNSEIGKFLLGIFHDASGFDPVKLIRMISVTLPGEGNGTPVLEGEIE